MEDGVESLEYEETDDAEIYFTINVNSTIECHGDDDTLALADQRITSSVDDGSLDDRNLMFIVLEDWLVQSVRNSPDQRMTWDEVLSLYRTSTSSLLLSWLMSQGPEGLFHFFTTQLPGSVIVCHNLFKYKSAISHPTPPTTISRTSSPNDDNQGELDIVLINAEQATCTGSIADNASKVIETIDCVDIDTNFERVGTNDNLSCNSFQSYAYTYSMETTSIQNNSCEDGEDYDNAIDYRNAFSIENGEIWSALVGQYCKYDDIDSEFDDSTISLSPAESPDYKNNSIKELLFYPESVWWNNFLECHWKGNVAIWLLNLLSESSSIKLWFDFVEMEFMNTFGIMSTPNLMQWIKNDIPGVTLNISTFDGELYVYQSSTLTRLLIVWDMIEEEGD